MRFGNRRGEVEKAREAAERAREDLAATRGETDPSDGYEDFPEPEPVSEPQVYSSKLEGQRARARQLEAQLEAAEERVKHADARRRPAAEARGGRLRAEVDALWRELPENRPLIGSVYSAKRDPFELRQCASCEEYLEESGSDLCPSCWSNPQPPRTREH